MRIRHDASRRRSCVGLAYCLFAVVAIAGICSSSARGETHLSWTRFPPIPDVEGFAGMVAGVSDGQLIAAGGANFPDGYPWQGGKKAWYDDIFVLDKVDGTWRRAETRLPRPLAYAVSATYEDSVIVAGGETGPPDDTNAGDAPSIAAPSYRADVFRIRLRNDSIEVETLPPLPRAAAHQCGAILGPTLYVLGGSPSPDATMALNVFWALDLSKPRDEMRWEECQTPPGPPRMQAIAGAHDGKFYVFGGIELAADANGKPRRIEPYLVDAYCFMPNENLGRGGENGRDLTGEWKRLANLPREVAAAASPAISIGNELFVIGGTSAAAQHLDAQSHPGWSTDLLAYSTEHDTWRVLPDAAPAHSTRVTLPTTRWNNKFIVVSGERSPGRRSPEVFAIEPDLPAEASSERDAAVDPNYAIVAVAVFICAVLLALVARYMRRNSKTHASTP